MKRIVKLGICILTLSLVGALPVEAQPQRGMRDSEGMMGMMRGARVEQVLAFLAFDEKVDVTDEQFLKLRKVLKGFYVEQQDMMEEMQEMRRAGGGDFQELFEEMTEIREEMNEKISAVLDAEQVKLFEEYMKTLASRRGGFQRRSSGGGRGGDRF